MAANLGMTVILPKIKLMVSGKRVTVEDRVPMHLCAGVKESENDCQLNTLSQKFRKMNHMATGESAKPQESSDHYTRWHWRQGPDNGD